MHNIKPIPPDRNEIDVRYNFIIIMITVVVSICYRVKSVFLLCVFPPDGCSKQETDHRRHACTNDATNDPGLSQSVGSFIISCVRRAFDGRCGVCRKFNLGNFYIPLLNMVIRGEPNHKREKKKRLERNRRRKTGDYRSSSTLVRERSVFRCFFWFRSIQFLFYRWIICGDLICQLSSCGNSGELFNYGNLLLGRCAAAVATRTTLIYSILHNSSTRANVLHIDVNFKACCQPRSRS